MKLASLNESVKKIQNKSTPQKQPLQLKDMLKTMLGLIERFEKNGKIDFKGHKERMDFLKDFVTSFIKDEQEKKLLRGGQ